jgi:hypothetical protein
MRKPIGGFFELEPAGSDLARQDGLYHANALALSTGRACIGYILDQPFESKKPMRCYVPSYSCDAVYEPFLERDISLEYYSITEQFELQHEINLKSDEYLFYINFFGIKHQYTEQLIERYGDQLIIDSTHSFFHKGYPRNWSFTSARKYFGVADGAFVLGFSDEAHDRRALGDRSLENSHLPRFDNPDLSPNKLRADGEFAKAYSAYQAYEKRLNADVLRISKVSEAMLKDIDYDAVTSLRQANFQYYHKELAAYNQIQFDQKTIQELEGNELKEHTAFCYPFLPKTRIEKTLLHQEQFFIPALWADVLNRPNDDVTGKVIGNESTESKLCHDLLPLPIDHRYTQQDLEPLVRFIKENLNV